jgi:hypothetical protein
LAYFLVIWHIFWLGIWHIFWLGIWHIFWLFGILSQLWYVVARKIWQPWLPGGDVMITIFFDFRQFSAKNRPFSQKPLSLSILL